jgi:hypothetical protein
MLWSFRPTRYRGVTLALSERFAAELIVARGDAFLEGYAWHCAFGDRR